VGLADKLLGLLIEQMLLVGYIRGMQGANQDKSRMGDARESTQEKPERNLDSRLHGND
jgi:hypothetical protein